MSLYSSHKWRQKFPCSCGNTPCLRAAQVTTKAIQTLGGNLQSPTEFYLILGLSTLSGTAFQNSTSFSGCMSNATVRLRLITDNPQAPGGQTYTSFLKRFMQRAHSGCSIFVALNRELSVFHLPSGPWNSLSKWLSRAEEDAPRQWDHPDCKDEGGITEENSDTFCSLCGWATHGASLAGWANGTLSCGGLHTGGHS